jgi:hypothetical protein
MKLARNWGMLLLGIWLIMTGVTLLLHLSFLGQGPIMAILAIVAGGCILIGR